uniref:Apple domain-containing protein n=1 Tax=Myripristis murdjan TaxID=586833 RepID=A0A667WRZ7_9TELE
FHSRGSALLLFSLCVSLSISAECVRELLENVDFPGTDLTQLYSPDVNHCQLLCTQHPSCLFFTFIRADWTRDNRHFYCYLKSTPSGQPNVQKPLLGVTSGYSLKPCDPCLSQVYENVDFYGADYQTLFTVSYEECQRACTNDPSCQFFTFFNGIFTPEKIRYKCHLKFSWTVPRTPIVEAKPGVVSGFSHSLQIMTNSDTVCQARFFPNTDIPGNDLEKVLAGSAEHCLSLCSAHPRCTYFSYVTSDGSDRFSCFLKSNPNEMIISAKDGVTSGIPSRFCQQDNSWLKDTHDGVDFRGSDIRYVMLDDPETCQTTCSQDSNCQFYTYILCLILCPRRRCYLKRVITMPAPPKVTKLANVVSGFSLRNCKTDLGTDAITHTNV